MTPDLDRIFLQFSSDKLVQLASRITDCLGRLTAEQVWARQGENQNAVGNLVLHLCGNVRQWIIAGVGGAPDVRQRDFEFAARGGPEPGELARRLDETIREAVAVLKNVASDRLAARVRIQGYDITVFEAILQVVEHFSQHTGQVLFATKLSTGADLGYYRHLSRSAHGEKTP